MQAPRSTANRRLSSFAWLLAAWAAPGVLAQSPVAAPTPALEPQHETPAPAIPAPAASAPPMATPGGSPGPSESGPIAIVPLDSKDPASAAVVTGALSVAN